MGKAIGGAVAVTAVLAAVGCGGGNRLSKAEFTTKVNGLCSKYETKIDAATRDVGDSPAEIGKAVDKAIPIFDEALADFDAVKPPKDLDSRYDDWKKTNDEQLKAIKALGAAAKKNDQQGAQSAVARLDTLNKDSSRLANELGLKRCAA